MLPPDTDDEIHLSLYDYRKRKNGKKEVKNDLWVARQLDDCKTKPDTVATND